MADGLNRVHRRNVDILTAVASAGKRARIDGALPNAETKVRATGAPMGRMRSALRSAGRRLPAPVRRFIRAHRPSRR